MPALAHWFHLTPDDLDRMYPGEVQAFLDELEAIDRQQRKRR
jgi:hypothetical protein